MKRPSCMSPGWLRREAQSAPGPAVARGDGAARCASFALVTVIDVATGLPLSFEVVARRTLDAGYVRPVVGS